MRKGHNEWLRYNGEQSIFKEKAEHRCTFANY